MTTSIQSSALIFVGLYLSLLTSCCCTINDGPDTMCKGIRSKRHAQISTPPDIAGSWFSPSCEMLPGPQYVLRQYEFNASGRFTITRYYYSDQFCIKPSYAVRAEGSVSPESLSWYLNEATDMSMDLTRLSIRPYTHMMARILNQTLTMSCGMKTNWTSSKLDKVAVDARNKHCLDALSFSANELLVMRQVDYDPLPTQQGRGDNIERRSPTGHTERELQLGGVWFSQIKRPSSFQPPLYSVKHQDCKACKCIYKADLDTPPVFCQDERERMPPLSANLSGSWFSAECESVPNALFTLRSAVFDGTVTSFRMETHYFTDTFCTDPLFKLSAAGRATFSSKHLQLYNTALYKFKFEQLNVTVYSSSMQKLLNLGNSDQCGYVSEWTLGRDYDIISTKGCESLGIAVKISNYALLKTEHLHDTDYLTMSELKHQEEDFYSKITHFTSKLRHCKKEPMKWFHFSSSKQTKHIISSATLRHVNIYTYILFLIIQIVVVLPTS